MVIPLEKNLAKWTTTHEHMPQSTVGGPWKRKSTVPSTVATSVRHRRRCRVIVNGGGGLPFPPRPSTGRPDKTTTAAAAAAATAAIAADPPALSLVDVFVYRDVVARHGRRRIDFASAGFLYRLN